MSLRLDKTWIGTVALALATAALGLLACGQETPDTTDSGAADPESALSLDEATAPLGGRGASAKLESLRAEANEIIDGGREGFEARLAELEGTPVVVNNWASWCGPCREEFPYFQAQAIEREDEVAFIGLLSGDGPETGGTFLARFPIPYPSYLDANFDISLDLGTARRLPSTAFYDPSGELAYLKSGPYTSEEQLSADIERYAG